MMGLRAELEGRFNRKLPEGRDILVLDSTQNTVTALPNKYRIAFLLEQLKTANPIIVDLAHDRVFLIDEITSAEFLLRLEVIPKDTN